MEANNMAALREACANIAEYAKSAQCHTDEAHVLGYLRQMENWAQAALALPRRNCDVGTAEEQDRRMTDFCNSRHCEDCQIYDSESPCALAWAQLPYADEGGAK